MHSNVYDAVVFRFILLNFSFQVIVAVIAPYVQIILRNKGYSHSMVGLVVAIGQLGSIILPLLISGVSDKTRRTKLLFLILALVCAVVFIPMALSPSVAITAISLFVVSGMYLSISPLIDGYQNRLLNGDAQKYGIARSAGTMGYVLALALFSLIRFPKETDNSSIALCLAIATAVFMAVVLFIPKDLPPEKDSKKRKSISGLFSKRFYLMMVVIGLSRVAHAIPDRLLSSYMVEVLGLGGNFALFVSLGALSEFVMMNIGGILLEKKKTTPYTLIVLGSFALAVRLLVYRFFPSVLGLVFAQLLHSMTFGSYHIAATQFIAHDVQKEHYSVAMSFYWAIATNLPQMLGSLAGGVVIDRFGYNILFSSFSLFPILATVLALLCRGILKAKPLD